jgi:hypothetical protein
LVCGIWHIGLIILAKRKQPDFSLREYFSLNLYMVKKWCLIIFDEVRWRADSNLYGRISRMPVFLWLYIDLQIGLSYPIRFEQHLTQLTNGAIILNKKF